jgi:hypothetical protein
MVASFKDKVKELTAQLAASKEAAVASGVDADKAISSAAGVALAHEKAVAALHAKLEKAVASAVAAEAQATADKEAAAKVRSSLVGLSRLQVFSVCAYACNCVFTYDCILAGVWASCLAVWCYCRHADVCLLLR